MNCPPTTCRSTIGFSCCGANLACWHCGGICLSVYRVAVQPRDIHLLAFEKHVLNRQACRRHFGFLCCSCFCRRWDSLFPDGVLHQRLSRVCVLDERHVRLDFTYIAFSNVVRAPLLRFMLWFPSCSSQMASVFRSREKNKAGATNNGTSPPPRQTIGKSRVNGSIRRPICRRRGAAMDVERFVDRHIQSLLLRYGMTYAHRNFCLRS